MPSCASRLAFLALLALIPACAHRGGALRTDPAAAPVATLPPVPAAVLEASASSLDVSLRLRAIELLCSHSPAGELEGWAQRGLFDPSPYVRRAVVETLALRLDEPVARRLLLSVLEREDVDAYTRGRAGFLLVRAGVDEARAPMERAWRAAANSWDRAPLALAALQGGDDEAEQALAEALKDGAIPLETEFFVAIGQTGRRSLAPALVEARELLEEELLLPVGEALIQLGVAEGEQVFRETFADGDVLSQLEAIDYLAQLEGQRAVALLRKARGGSPIVRSYAELVMVSRGDQPLAGAVAAAEVDDREQQCMAFEAMERHLSVVPPEDQPRRSLRAARDLALAGLADPEPMVRGCAARALGAVAGPADRPELAALIDELSGDDAAESLRLELAAALIAIQ